MLIIGLFFFLQGFAVGDEAGKEGFASFDAVGIVAGPSVESGVLEGTSKTKSNWPGERTMLDDGSEVVSSLFDGLSAREEDDTGKVG